MTTHACSYPFILNGLNSFLRVIYFPRGPPLTGIPVVQRQRSVSAIHSLRGNARTARLTLSSIIFAIPTSSSFPLPPHPTFPHASDSYFSYIKPVSWCEGKSPGSGWYKSVGAWPRAQPVPGLSLASGQWHWLWGSRRGSTRGFPRRDDELPYVDTHRPPVQPNRRARG